MRSMDESVELNPGVEINRPTMTVQELLSYVILVPWKQTVMPETP